MDNGNHHPCRMPFLTAEGILGIRDAGCYFYARHVATELTPRMYKRVGDEVYACFSVSVDLPCTLVGEIKDFTKGYEVSYSECDWM